MLTRMYFTVGLRWSLAFDFSSNSTYLEIRETVLLTCSTSINSHRLTLYHPDSTGNQCSNQSCSCTVLGGCEIQPSSKCSRVVTIASTCNYALGFLAVNVLLNDSELLGTWTCKDEQLSSTSPSPKFTSLMQFSGLTFYALLFTTVD